MMLSRSTAALVAIATAIPALPSAWGSGGDRVPGSRYVSARGAAMGDSYIPFADSTADGLFYNPAALAKNLGFKAEPLNLEIETNPGLNSLFGSDFYKFQSLSSYDANLTEHPGRRAGASFALLPNFGFKGLGVGMLYQRRMLGESLDGVNVHYRSTYEFVPAIGYGLRLASGVLRIGYSLQWVNKSETDRTVAASAATAWNDGAAEGRGFSQNLGISLTLPVQFQPSLHVVARNIGGVHYSGKPYLSLSKNPSGAAATEDMSVDTAAGIRTKIGSGWNLSTSFTYRDATNSANVGTLEHVEAGTELEIAERFFLRGGFGNGYPSAGFGLRTGRAEAAFAWYSEDVGVGAGHARDIRYLFQVAFGTF